MILTDDFVFLHPPKTGGTFVAAMLARLYPAGTQRVRARLGGTQPLGAPARQHVHKHAARHQIPASHAHLPVLATVRSPFEAYVSIYEFGEWRKGRANAELSRYDWDRVHHDYPSFPDLTFSQFCRVFAQVGYRLDTPDRSDLGWQTVRYAAQFAPAPAPDVTSSSHDIVTALTVGTRDVRFIHTENLNQELFERRGEVGVPEDRRRFILDAAKVLPTKGGRRPDQAWHAYYDEDLMAHVRLIDAAMLTRFPEYAELGR